MNAPITSAEIAGLERLLAGGNVTPGPYGFQAYGRRERLVTMAAATQGGSGEPFAIFNRSEDARAFARAVSALPRLLAEIKRAREADPVLIWSNEHRAWWRGNSAGYTTHVAGAGRYSATEAIEICATARNGFDPEAVPTEIPVREADVLAALAALAQHRSRK